MICKAFRVDGPKTLVQFQAAKCGTRIATFHSWFQRRKKLKGDASTSEYRLPASKRQTKFIGLILPGGGRQPPGRRLPESARVKAWMPPLVMDWSTSSLEATPRLPRHARSAVRLGVAKQCLPRHRGPRGGRGSHHRAIEAASNQCPDSLVRPLRLFEGHTQAKRYPLSDERTCGSCTGAPHDGSFPEISLRIATAFFGA